MVDSSVLDPVLRTALASAAEDRVTATGLNAAADQTLRRLERQKKQMATEQRRIIRALKTAGKEQRQRLRLSKSQVRGVMVARGWLFGKAAIRLWGLRVVTNIAGILCVCLKLLALLGVAALTAALGGG